MYDTEHYHHGRAAAYASIVQLLSGPMSRQEILRQVSIDQVRAEEAATDRARLAREKAPG